MNISFEVMGESEQLLLASLDDPTKKAFLKEVFSLAVNVYVLHQQNPEYEIVMVPINTEIMDDVRLLAEAQNIHQSSLIETVLYEYVMNKGGL